MSNKPDEEKVEQLELIESKKENTQTDISEVILTPKENTDNQNMIKVDALPHEEKAESTERAPTPSKDTAKNIPQEIPFPEEAPLPTGGRRQNTKPVVTKQLSAELDMELKVKFKKILWKMGHYGRLDVKIASYGEYENGRRDGVAELTDIDVWGFNLQDDFQINNLVVDCKNGESISPTSRLFWIKGVMEYVGNAKGFMVMGKKDIPSYLREIGNKFHVSLMDSKNLTALERIYNIDDLEQYEFFSDEYFHKQERISEKALDEMLDYRKYHYWINDDHTKIHNIINILSKYSSKLYHENKNHQILVMDFIMLFTIAFFNLCSFIARTSISQPKTGVLLFLYDGPYNLDRYVNVLDLVDKVFKATARNYNELKGLLDYKPAFFEDLVELCIGILRRPSESKNILRYMDVIMYSIIMPKKDEKRTLKSVFKEEFNEITLKLTLDIVDFILKNTKLSNKLIPRDLILK